MRWPFFLALVAIGVIFAAGCQLTVDDIRPVHLRGGGGVEAPPEPKPEPKVEPPRQTGKDVIYVLGLHGID